MKKYLKPLISLFLALIVFVLVFFVLCKDLNQNSDYNYISYEKEKKIELKEKKDILSKKDVGIFLPIFMYHHIKDVPSGDKMPGLFMPKDIFRSQIQELKKMGYEAIFMKDYVYTLKNNPNKKYVITIDDGYDDNYYNAFEVLKTENVKATIYIIVNAIDKPGYLTKTQIEEMKNSGLVEFASHTMNHIDLKKADDKKRNYEILESKIILEKILGEKVYSFAYPYGSYNEKCTDVASNTYSNIVTTSPGSHHNDSFFNIKRIRPVKNSGEDFKNWFLKLY